MLILLWGLRTEAPLAAVWNELQHSNLPVVLLDQRDARATEMQLSVNDRIEGSICYRDQKIDLAGITAVYARPYDSRCIPNIARAGPSSSLWRHALALEDLLMSWLEITPALVVNRLSAMGSNSSKPYQLESIRQFGFSIPETLITTDPDAVRSFWERQGQIIYKSVSGVRSIVSHLEPAHLERLADVANCPTQFQQYIPGMDHRVHVVGQEVFACQVISDAVDYRFAGRQPVEIRACQLPQDVEDRCRLLAMALQLHVAGIDLRRTNDGEWYCFEVNPSPAFTYYQEETNQPISYAIAKLLSSNPPYRVNATQLAASMKDFSRPTMLHA